MALTAPRQANQRQVHGPEAGAIVDIRPHPQPRRWTANIRTPTGERVPVHSVNDPVAEARAQVASISSDRRVIAIIGAGLGFVTEAARERFPHARIVVVEPLAPLAFGARARTPALYSSDRVHVIVGPDFEGAGELWRLFDGGVTDEVDPAIVLHPVLMRAVPHAMATAVIMVRRAINAAEMNARARRDNAGRYVLNTLRNLPHVVDGADPGRLAGHFAGVPAVVVAAGPSLDRNLDALGQLSRRALIVATDTAWRPLVAAGIDPHFVVALDPTTANGRHLSGVPGRQETWLLAEGSVDPDAVGRFAGRVGVFRVGSHQPWPWIESLGLHRPVVRVWGSVLTAAYDLPRTFGCDPIIFVGADLAFTDKRPYCRGTSFEIDWARHAARGVSLRQIWQNTLASRALLSEPDVDGQCVLTAPHLVEFRNWLVARAGEDSGRRVINATGAGILAGPGVEQSDLATALEPRPDIDDTLRQSIRTRLGSRAIPGRDRAVGLALSTIERATRAAEKGTAARPVADWLTFGRPSLTPAAIRQAVVASRDAIEHPTAYRDRDTREPSRHDTPALRLHEADRVARVRALLTGDDTVLDGCEIPDGPSATLLSPAAAADAARVLGALLALPHLTTAFGEDIIGGATPDTVPLSWRFVWTPEAAPWVAALEELQVEGALGLRADLTAIEPDRSSFWRGPIEPVLDGPDEPAATWPSDHERDARLTLTALRLALVATSDGAPETGRDRLMHAVRAGAADPDLRLTSPAPYRLEMLGADSSAPLPLRIDGLMRALTGTLARTTEASGDAPVCHERVWPDLQAVVVSNGTGVDPRLAFLGNDIDHVEPDVLTDRGLSRGWSLASAGRDEALFVPSGALESVLIRADGRTRTGLLWPVAITGELPWGAEGGALAWNAITSTLLLRPHAGAVPIVESVPFRPARVVVAQDGSVYWSAFDGGLWTWFPGQSGRRLADAPTSAGLRVDAGDLVVSPIVRDDAGRVRRERLLYEWRYAIAAPVLREVPACREGQCAAVAIRDGWTARTYPFSDLVRLDEASGHSLILACHTPTGVAWAGPSLVVTTGEGMVLLFRELFDRLAPVTSTLARRAS